MKFLVPLLFLPGHESMNREHFPSDEVCLTARAATNTLSREGEWRFDPEVLLCAGSPVTFNRTERAINYWKKLGYVFREPQQAPRDSFACATGNVPYNTIMIDIPSQNFKMGKHIGSTRTWRSEGTQIFKAKIEIIPAWGDSERILEHELGHALGWNDVARTGHIMNGTWSLGGYNSIGLKK
jgi:hypothetical protein